MTSHAVLPGAAAIAIAAALSNAAMAAEAPASTWGDIVNANNQVSLDFIDTNFNYEEFNDTSRSPFFGAGILDSEMGWVPGLSVSGSLMRNWFVDNIYLYGQFSWSRGKTNYTGSPSQPLFAAVPGVFGSLVGRDGAYITDFDFRSGKGFAIQPNVMLTPFLGAGWHDWDRRVNLGENYTNGYAGGGLLLQFSPFSRFVVSADGLIGGTFASHISVAGTPIAITATGAPLQRGFSGPLGNSALFMAGLSGDYALTQAIHVNAGLDYVYFRYGESALYPAGCLQAVGAAVGCAYEPSDRTSNLTLKVGLGYGF